MKISILTAGEEQLMRVIWRLGSFFTKDLIEAYPEPKPHQNTISTYLKILTEKNFLEVEKVGRIFRYTAVISMQEYQIFILKNFVKQYFNGNPSEFAKFLIENKIFSIEDFGQYFEMKTTIIPTIKTKEQSKNQDISDFVKEITKTKKKKKKKK